MKKVNCSKYRKKTYLNLYIDKDIKKSIVEFCRKNNIKPAKLLSDIFGNVIKSDNEVI